MELRCLAKAQKDNTEPSLYKQEGVTTMYPADSKTARRYSLDSQGTVRGSRNDYPLWLRQLIGHRRMDIVANDMGELLGTPTVKVQSPTISVLRDSSTQTKAILESFNKDTNATPGESFRADGTVATTTSAPLDKSAIIHIPDSQSQRRQDMTNGLWYNLYSIRVEQSTELPKVWMCDCAKSHGIVCATHNMSDGATERLEHYRLPVDVIFLPGGVRELQGVIPKPTMQRRNTSISKQCAYNNLTLSQAKALRISYPIPNRSRQSNAKMLHMPVENTKIALSIAQLLSSLNNRISISHKINDLFSSWGHACLSHMHIVPHFRAICQYHSYQVTDRKENNAKPVEDGKYVVLLHPDTLYDLEGDSNITNLWHYGGAGDKQGQIFDTTFKDLPMGFRVYESSILPITRASGYGDVYNTFVLGAEAYGTVKLETMPAKVIVHLPGESGVSDPLDQVATVGWKANFACAILNQSNLVLIKHQTSTFTGTRAGL